MTAIGTVATVVSICVGIVTLLGSGLAIGAYWMKTTVDSANAKLKESLRNEITNQAVAFTAQMNSQAISLNTQMASLTDKITSQTLSFQSLKTDIMDRIDLKLDEYVRKQTFNDYKDTHDKVHADLDKEMGALRQFKHDTNSLLREHDVKIKDSQGDISKLGQDGVKDK